MFMTLEEAEEIMMAVQIGVYDLDYPGARSKLAHARLLLIGQEDLDPAYAEYNKIREQAGLSPLQG